MLKKCPKCSGKMIEGELYSLSFFYGSSASPLWWGENKKYSPLKGFKFENDRYVVNYRCEECGYVETYTKELYKPKK